MLLQGLLLILRAALILIVYTAVYLSLIGWTLVISLDTQWPKPDPEAWHWVLRGGDSRAVTIFKKD